MRFNYHNFTYDQLQIHLICSPPLEKYPHLLIYYPHLPEHYPHFRYFHWIHCYYPHFQKNYFLLLVYVLRLYFTHHQWWGYNQKMDHEAQEENRRRIRCKCRDTILKGRSRGVIHLQIFAVDHEWHSVLLFSSKICHRFAIDRQVLYCVVFGSFCIDFHWKYHQLLPFVSFQVKRVASQQ